MDKTFGPEASEQPATDGVKGLVVMRRQLRLAHLADQGRHIEPPGSNALCFSFGPKTPLKRPPSAFPMPKTKIHGRPGFRPPAWHLLHSNPSIVAL